MSTFEIISAWILIATICAIVISPIAAVLITRYGDEQREKKARKYTVFSSLMKTRAWRLSPEHVAALNSIQVEFFGCEKVISAYKAYMRHLNFPEPTIEAEKIIFVSTRNDLMVELVHEIGCDIGYKFDKSDIEKFGYSPPGWADEEDAEKVLRSQMMDMLSGTKSLKVTLHATRIDNEMFPAPPEPETKP